MTLHKPKLIGDINPSMDENALFDVLSSPRRRRLLQLLHQRDGKHELKDLAANVAAAEVGSSVDDLTKAERKRVYISCYQTHLPRLVEAGLVSYDTDTGVVERTDDFSDVASYLGWQTETPWPHRYYLGLALASVAFYGGVLLEFPLLDTLSLSVAGLAVVVSFVSLTVGLLLRDRRSRLALQSNVARPR